MLPTVRPERPGDAPLIRRIHEQAFGGVAEADLVDALRGSREELLSLVADDGTIVVGHVLFSRMTIDTATGSIGAVALAPVAVLPPHQRQGVGQALIERGLDILRQRGEQIAIVVGHAAYYPRFGFSLTLAQRLEAPFPREVLMALELSPGALGGVHGRVRYPAAFGLE